MDEAQVYGPRDYPHEGPILAAWGGHYDHGYIALHPFTYVESAHHLSPIPWSTVARALGSPEFSEFALAVCLAANGMDGSHRPDANKALISDLMGYVRANHLCYPEDSHFPKAWCICVNYLLSKLGTDHAIVSDYTATGPVEQAIRLDDLKDANMPEPVNAVADPSHHFIVTTHPMDTYDSIVGVTQQALDAFGGVLPFEGFAVTSDTTSSWVNQPGTYSYPGWLA